MFEPAHISRMRSAPFLVLEGVDGSGKSSQVPLLAAWLQEQGAAVKVTREPGGTVLAERLRALILDQAVGCVPRAELLMLLAARAQHVAEVIEPALLAGTMVVSDRFSLSSLAYQGYGRGLPLADIRQADAVATGAVHPTLTVLLDVPFHAAFARIGARQDRFEGEGQQFLERVIEGYRELAATDPTVRIIDGTGTLVQVQEEIRRIVRPVIADFITAEGEKS
jgi:dTMP kinase